MKPSLCIAGVPFYDAPSEIEGSPYWVDLWTDINGYKIGLQVKPKSYNCASVSIYMGKARSSEEKGHRLFKQNFGGQVFVVMPIEGCVPKTIEDKILNEVELLKKMPKRK